MIDSDIRRTIDGNPTERAARSSRTWSPGR